MVGNKAIDVKEKHPAVAKLRDYLQMMKLNLSFMIAFSSIIGYLLAPGISFSWEMVCKLFIGGMLVTISSNIINQIIERYSDREMKRTQTRPLPTGRMAVPEAVAITILTGLGGILWLGYFFNPLTGILSLASLFLYGFAYTLLKRKGPIATFVGAIPGSLPPLLGWVAATNSIFAEGDLLGWLLFAIQFFWQFPHFWSIAWLGYDEYLKAGIMMLPSRQGKTTFTGMQCMFYSIPLMPLAVMIYMLGYVGGLGTLFAVGFGVFFFIMAVRFYRDSNNTTAKQLLYSSFLYLPGVLLSLVLDKL